MKRIVLALVLLAGCRSAPREGTQVTGAASPRAAVDRLLSAIHDQDLQALGAVWGDKRGAARDIMQRDEYDQRVIIMQCYFSHDQSRILTGFPLTPSPINRERCFDAWRGLRGSSRPHRADRLHRPV